MVVAPIMFQDNFYGTLALSHTQSNFFIEFEVELVKWLSQELGMTIYRLKAAHDEQEAKLMSSLGKSSYNVTHRLIGDLGTVNARVARIRNALKQKKALDPNIEDNLQRISAQATKVIERVVSLKKDIAQNKFITDPKKDKESISLKILLKEIVESFTPFPAHIDIQYKVDNKLPNIQAAPAVITIILGNLINNAIEAMPNGGKIEVTAQQDGKFMMIYVKDTGPGIPENIVEKVFDLGFTTKKSSGFGLNASRKDAIENGGDLFIEETSSQGTTFKLKLPL
jgi:signal transduction histidine kinase